MSFETDRARILEAVTEASKASERLSPLSVDRIKRALGELVFSTEVLVSHYPGAPVYDVRNYGAVGDGVADDTAAINAAIAAANTNPGRIYLMKRHRITSELTSITNHNISLLGRGEFNGGTTIRIDSNPLPAQLLHITGQYALVQDIWFGAPHQAVNTTSYCLYLNSYRPTVKNVVISTFGNGIKIRSNTAYCENVQITDPLGDYMFLVEGSIDGFTHNTQFVKCGGGGHYPLAIGTPRGNWAQSTAYSVGEIVKANGGLWQCSTAGTSAASGAGPSGLPSTNPSLVHSTPVVDGTAQWLYGMGAYAGFGHGSYAHTVMYDRCGVLQGDVGMRVFDTAAVPAVFIHAWQFSSDHPFTHGIDLQACNGAVMFDQSLCISILMGGAGVNIGEDANLWQFNGGAVDGTGFAVAGTRGVIRGVQCNAVSLAATASIISVIDNQCVGTPGITVASGADNYIITSNYTPNGITNTPGTSATRVVANNIGTVT